MFKRAFRALFDFPGYVLDKVSASADVAQITLRRDKRCKTVCPVCQVPLQVHRTLQQVAQDLPLGSARLVQVVYEAVQGRCPTCRGYTTVHPPGIDSRARATQRVKAYVSCLCRYMPLSHVNEVVPLSPATALRWDKAYLAEHLPDPNLEDLRILLVDEKAVRTGYGYVTLVMNGETGELLYWAEGKKKESLTPFFERLTAAQKAGIEAIGMDRNGAYRQVAREQVPHAAVIYDKFHLIQNYHKVMDKVRNREYQKAKEEDQAIIKGQRFNLYRNPENLREDQAHDLARLLAVNATLETTYVLKDAFKQLWSYTYTKCALSYLTKWISWVRESAIAPLIAFAEAIWRDREEVLAYCRHPITTARLESFNNTVSRLVHRACGHKDLDYLFLKVRQESINSLQQK